MSARNRLSRKDRSAAVEAALSRHWPRSGGTAKDGRPDDASSSQAAQDIANRVEAIWTDVPLLRGRERYQELLGQPTWRERVVAAYRNALATLDSVGRAPAFAASAALLLIVAFTLTIATTPSTAPARSFETAKAQMKSIQLEDGSAVTLGAQSAVRVDYTRQTRNVTLAAGEAFFSVTHDPSRPFIVDAGDTKIEVVGTKFNVNRTASGVRVSVLEGVVRVIKAGSQTTTERPAAPEAREVALHPGQQATVDEGGAALHVASLTIAQPGSWRTGSLTYEDATLAQIVADANRYYPHQIRIASAKGADMRLTTAFKTNQVDQFLETVQTALPLDVRRDPAGEITIADRRQAPAH
jgi:transmembrane sensor